MRHSVLVFVLQAFFHEVTPGSHGSGHGKCAVVLASRCDLVTEVLASLLSGFIKVLSRLTTRKSVAKWQT